MTPSTDACEKRGYGIKIIGRSGGISYIALGGIEGPKRDAYGYRDAETARQAAASHQRRWGRANVNYEVVSLDDQE